LLYSGTDSAIDSIIKIFSIMNKRIFVTLNDYQRIIGMIEFAAMRTKIPDAVDSLLTNLKGARMLPQENISEDIITMNSRARLTELSSGKEIEITVTYPQDADNILKKISVFSPIGITLLGAKVGDVVSWKVPSGIGHFRIDKVIYQPEAVGHYHL
jgi:regulator of nucleoside diphosphate kinase